MTPEEENKIRNRKRLRTIKRPFVSINHEGHAILNKTACAALDLSPGDYIEWHKGKPVKAEKGMKLARLSKGVLQFRCAMLAHLLKVEDRKRIYFQAA